MSRVVYFLLLPLVAWIFAPWAWGQSQPSAFVQRPEPARVLGPGPVVPATTKVRVDNQVSDLHRSEPIPMKGSSESQANRVAAPRSPWSATLSMLFSLSLVVFLFMGAAMILRKSQPKQFQKLPKDVVEVLGRTSIAPRQSLILMRFGSKLLLVSQQPGETRSIAEISEPNEVTRLSGMCESSRPESISNSFRDVLQQVVHAKPVRQA
jgi:flagellar biogenesis protein FliO